jgi:enoyl-CoA hydratase/carnithine racemase
VTGSPGVVVSTSGGVALLTMARPERRNALDEPLAGELRAALERAADDSSVRGVIITGQGRAFSAGGDLSRLPQEWDPAVFRRDSHRLTELITLPERIEKPGIAAINGVLTVVPDEQLLDQARARLGAILERGAQAYGVAKRLLGLAAGVDLVSGILAESLAQSGLIKTEEHRKRVGAALAQRRGSQRKEG